MTPPLSRRSLLRAGAGLGAAGAAASLTGCGTPLAATVLGAQPDVADVVFWHLFGGGDGANMGTMVGDVRAADGFSVESTLLSWGNPYYTKLALSTSSGRPPDVAVAHLSRLPLLARAGLLTPLAETSVADAGIVEDRFTPAAWGGATVDGTPYAVPLDTHPFVVYYNTDLAERAGLLDADGALRPIEGRDAFVDALRAMQETGAQYGAISANTTDPSTCWRFFTTVYAGLAGPIVSDLGTRITLERDAAEETFAFLQSLTGDLGLMPGNATPVLVSTLFGQGQAGFLFDGVWQIPTYRGVTLPDGEPLAFDVVPFPALLGPEAVSYADSHALVLPSRRSADPAREAAAVGFVRGILDDSSVWAEGGHVPAWLPVQESAAFRELQPQSNYVQAAFDAVYDPPGWYTGAGSDFQNAMGDVIASVLGGRLTPTAAVDRMTESLRAFSTARPPVT